MVEVLLFVLRVSEEKVDFLVGHEVLDDPDATTLATAARRPADFAQTATPANHVARSWFERQGDLQLTVVGVIKQQGDLLGKNLRFDKMLTTNSTPMA